MSGGKFDRETYRFALERNNLTEADFETGLREDLARSLLQGAVIGGFAAPAALTDTLYAYIAERRGLSLLRLSEADLQPRPLPTRPMPICRHIMTPISPTSPAPKPSASPMPPCCPKPLPTTCRLMMPPCATYTRNASTNSFSPNAGLSNGWCFRPRPMPAPPRPGSTPAKAFEALVAERGLALSDVDMGDVSPADLGAAGEAVFALTEPGVVGPLVSDLGPALFRMNAVLAAQEIPFEDARDDLRVEYQLTPPAASLATRSKQSTMSWLVGPRWKTWPPKMA